MAWTPVGGEVLFVEATRMPGKGGLLMTGSLGEVMKESAQTAVSYLRSQSAALGIDLADYSQFDIHIHVPAGATPKDGPSAGVALVAALASLLTRRRVRSDVAMTGEISLRGRVLRVGGIKEKVLAAARFGLKSVILPDQNQPDWTEVPEEVRTQGAPLASKSLPPGAGLQFTAMSDADRERLLGRLAVPVAVALRAGDVSDEPHRNRHEWRRMRPGVLREQGLAGI